MFAGRAHFFAAAAEAMRHILIDAARRKQALRHGGGQVRVDIQDVEIACLAEEVSRLFTNCWTSLRRTIRNGPS